jgi:hypothetical protein
MQMNENQQLAPILAKRGKKQRREGGWRTRIIAGYISQAAAAVLSHQPIKLGVLI